MRVNTLLVVALLSAAAVARAQTIIPVDLQTGWSSDECTACTLDSQTGHEMAKWVVDDPNHVRQTTNNHMGIFYSPFESQGFSMVAGVQVFDPEDSPTGEFDNDFFGFVFGYKPNAVVDEGAEGPTGELTDDVEWLLLDWKQRNEFVTWPRATTFSQYNPFTPQAGHLAHKGMVLSKVYGSKFHHAKDFWFHPTQADLDGTGGAAPLEFTSEGPPTIDTLLRSPSALFAERGWPRNCKMYFRFENTARSLKVYLADVDDLILVPQGCSIADGPIADCPLNKYSTTPAGQAHCTKSLEEITDADWAIVLDYQVPEGEPDLPNGRFGFYTQSQEDVQFELWTVESIPTTTSTECEPAVHTAGDECEEARSHSDGKCVCLKWDRYGNCDSEEL
jgi:hypothetical protein